MSAHFEARVSIHSSADIRFHSRTLWKRPGNSRCERSKAFLPRTLLSSNRRRPERGQSLSAKTKTAGRSFRSKRTRQSCVLRDERPITSKDALRNRNGADSTNLFEAGLAAAAAAVSRSALKRFRSFSSSIHHWIELTKSADVSRRVCSPASSWGPPTRGAQPRVGSAALVVEGRCWERNSGPAFVARPSLGMTSSRTTKKTLSRAHRLQYYVQSCR